MRIANFLFPVQDQLNSLINELQESHGRESLYSSKDNRPLLPQLTHTSTPSLLTQATLSGRETAEGSASRVPVRPLYFLKPIPIEVSVDAVKVEGQSYKISKWNECNERMSNGWSDKIMPLQQCRHDRDYYQLEVEDGTQLTIFETFERKFFLQGCSG